MSTNSFSQTQNDSLQIKETVTKYIESFYLTQPKNGQESIHPLMAKRTVERFQDGKDYLRGMTSEEMRNVGVVFNKNGRYNEQSKKEITILDMMDKTASVKLVAEGWVDYIHLGKFNDQWKIVNVLWQWEEN
ncbi:MAG: nuclear transport factor 2 family protein [Gelidibacter sp.]|nr:nuclear transport factor 2 family protein [Gelidibacter sp.]